MVDKRFKTGLDFARNMDRSDELRSYKNQFYFSGEDLIYMDGNSLGRLPVKTREMLNEVIDHQWGNRLIRSWNEGWYDRTAEISRKLATIIGAEQEEVMVCDSTSVNLYKLVHAALKYSGRKKIISDDLNFPTDLYVLQGIIDQMGPGYTLELAESKDGLSISRDSLEEKIDKDTALVVLSHVCFKSAFMYDMEDITSLAHSNGALMLWDLSHAAGAVLLELSKCKVDLAVGCSYKFLNGGPGSPAFLYINKELHENFKSPIWGWFGEDNPFAFELEYRPAKGISRFLAGTPPILSLEAVEPGLDVMLSAGMDRIRGKSVMLSEYLIFLFEKILEKEGFLLGSPRESDMRGSHVSLKHKEAFRICKAMIEPIDKAVKVIPDFREPDNIRLGLTPLYTSFTDVFMAIERIRDIVENKEFEKYSGDRDAVT